ncbi:polar growth protein, partial [Ascosphaera pollenicola]
TAFPSCVHLCGTNIPRPSSVVILIPCKNSSLRYLILRVISKPAPSRSSAMSTPRAPRLSLADIEEVFRSLLSASLSPTVAQAQTPTPTRATTSRLIWSTTSVFALLPASPKTGRGDF